MTPTETSFSKLKKSLIEDSLVAADLESDQYIEALQEANLATYGNTSVNSILLEPKSIAELQRILEIIRARNSENRTLAEQANQQPYKHCFHVVSTMKNFGYGCADPVDDDAVLIRLKHLNISTEPSKRADEPFWSGKDGKEVGKVTVGPGVTQRSLYEFLKQEQSEYWLDATGSSEDSGVLSNSIQKGFGHIVPRHTRIVAMTAMLTSGKILNFGHGGFNNATNSGAFSSGLGPDFTGLGLQSNLFIVISISIRLLPPYKYVTPFFIRLNDDQTFGSIAVGLRRLKQDGSLISQIHCFNDHKIIQATKKFPFTENDGPPPLNEKVLAAIKKQEDIPNWLISGTICANSAIGLAIRAIKINLVTLKYRRIAIPLVKPLYQIRSLIFLNRVVRRLFPAKSERVRIQQKALKKLIEIKKGIPTNYFLASVYYMIKNVDTTDFDCLDLRRDNAGLIWTAPVEHLTENNIFKLKNITYEGQLKYGFDPAISMTLLEQDSVDCVVSLVFDKGDVEQEQKASRCFKYLNQQYMAAGSHFYRVNTLQMREDMNVSQEYSEFHDGIKSVTDPDNLFSPNRRAIGKVSN